MSKKVCSCHEQAKQLVPQDYPYKCPAIPGRVHVLCQKPGCNERVALDFGEMSKEDAQKTLANFGPFECPGFHVELNMWGWWQFEKALKVGFAN
jgi:hypothetical protein